jgi:hypothetical protein
MLIWGYGEFNVISREKAIRDNEYLRSWSLKYRTQKTKKNKIPKVIYVYGGFINLPCLSI